MSTFQLFLPMVSFGVLGTTLSEKKLVSDRQILVHFFLTVGKCLKKYVEIILPGKQMQLK